MEIQDQHVPQALTLGEPAPGQRLSNGATCIAVSAETTCTRRVGLVLAVTRDGVFAIWNFQVNDGRVTTTGGKYYQRLRDAMAEWDKPGMGTMIPTPYPTPSQS